MKFSGFRLMRNAKSVSRILSNEALWDAGFACALRGEPAEKDAPLVEFTGGAAFPAWVGCTTREKEVDFEEGRETAPPAAHWQSGPAGWQEP
jgi:hypothetical protein